jgi:hypothetical protein
MRLKVSKTRSNGFISMETAMVRKVSDAYLAGFIDGEGCLALERKIDRRGRWFRPRLTIGNTSLVVLECIQASIGAGFIQAHGRRLKPSHKPTWQYHLYGRKNLEPLVTRLEPLLIIKQEQARELIAFMRRMTKGGARLSESEIRAREESVARMHLLNRRGA